MTLTREEYEEMKAIGDSLDTSGTAMPSDMFQEAADRYNELQRKMMEPEEYQSQEVSMEEKKSGFVQGDRLTGEVVIIYAAIACTHEESRIASYHYTKHDAILGASGLGYSGPDGEVKPVLALKFSDGRYALVPEVIEIRENSGVEALLREQALKKLTPSERAALLGRFKK